MPVFRNLWVAVALPLLAGACAATSGYPSIPLDQPGANIRMTQRQDAPVGMVTEGQYYAFNDGEFCDTVKIVASLNWSTTKVVEIRIAPDRPIDISSSIRTTRGRGGMRNGYAAPTLDEHVCGSTVRLTPRNGHTYILSQESSAECPLSVVDADPLAPPPEIEQTRGCVDRPRPIS